MKPLLLEIEGFNSFEKKQIIDFEKLTSRGLFGIFGKTGSGKTSILDAIIYALYENIPRGTDNIVNANTNKCFIKYRFAIKGKNEGIYEIQRSVAKNKSEYEHTLAKTKTSSKKTKLIKINGDEQIVVADSKKEVDSKIQDIIGLEYTDFIKTVVLPQGEFSNFLKEKNKDRKKMLERLFALQKYGDELDLKIKNYRLFYEQINSDYEKSLQEYANIDEDSIKNLKENLEKINLVISDLEKKYLVLEEIKKEYELKEKYKKEYEQALEQYKEVFLYDEKIQDMRKKVEKLSMLSDIQDSIKNYKDYKNEIANLEKDIKELDEKIKKQSEQKKSLDESLIVFDEKMLKIPELQIKIQDIQKAISVKQNILQIKKEKEQSEILLEKNKSEKEKLENNVSNYKKDLSDIKNSISKTQEIIEKNTYKSEYKSDLRNGKTHILEKQKLEKQKSILEEELSKCKSNLQDEEKLIEKNKQLQKNIKSKLEQYTNEINEEYTVELYAKNTNTYSKLQEDKKTLSENEKQLSQYKKEQEKNEEQIKILLDKKKEKEEEYSILQEQIRICEKKSLVKKLRQDLNDMDICPVCNNVYHLCEDDYSDIIEPIDDKTMQDEIYFIDKNLAILENENKNIGIQNEKISKKIQEIKSKYDEDIGILIDNTKKYLENYNEYSKKAEENQKNKKLDEEKLNSVTTTIKLSEKEIENIEKLISEKTSTVKECETSIKNIDIIIYDICKKNNIVENEILSLNEDIQKSELIIEKHSININKEKQKYDEIDAKIQKSQEYINDISMKINDIMLNIQNLKSNYDIQIFQISDSRLLSNDDLRSLLKTKQQEIVDIKNNYEKLKDSANSLEKIINEDTILLATKNTKYEMNKQIYEKSEKIILAFVKDNDFKDIQSLFSLNEEYPKLEEKKSKIQNYEKILSEKEIAKNNAYKLYTSQEKILEQTPYNSEQYTNIKNELTQKNQELGYTKNKLENEQEIYEKKKEIIKKSKDVSKILNEVYEIEKLFKGKEFVQFLAKYQLSYVCKKASEILESISAGRFSIMLDDDAEFIISDYQNGGIKRQSSTLSGGETFLVSLSLALALSSHIQLKGNAKLEFFFMDEGFGTLDSQSLDVAINCLKKINSKDLSIGIISHIDKIKQEVPVKLEIKKDDILNNSSIAKIVVG